jgi:hypothetical protein
VPTKTSTAKEHVQYHKDDKDGTFGRKDRQSMECLPDWVLISCRIIEVHHVPKRV